MDQDKKPREFVVITNVVNGFNTLSVQPYRKGLDQLVNYMRVIEHTAYLAEKKRADILEKKLAKAVEQRDWLAKNTPAICSHFNGDISGLNKELDAISFSDEKDVGKDEK